MQLAKVSAALARLDEAAALHFRTTDPTTGVTASFAMLGDLNIGEPGAPLVLPGPALSNKPSDKTAGRIPALRISS
jgi:acetyl-CoA carboxylase carboxyl transferase subunit beta